MNNYSNDIRGSFQNKEQAKQLVSFEGLRFTGKSGYNNVTPTDIDGVIQLEKENCIIFFELKYSGGAPLGQQQALERMCDAITDGGVNCIVLIAIHNTPAPQTIIAKDAYVARYYWKRKWITCDKKSLYECICLYIGYLNRNAK